MLLSSSSINVPLYRCKIHNSAFLGEKERAADGKGVAARYEEGSKSASGGGMQIRFASDLLQYKTLSTKRQGLF